MRQGLGWVFIIICALCAPVLIVMSFILSSAPEAGGVRIGVAEFLIPIALSWLAVFPRSRREWRDLWTGHPIAQRFFGGKAAGFFGDYRRKLTPVGSIMLYGTIGLFLFSLYMGAVHIELFIIGFLFLVALTSWIIRLEMQGDRTAAAIRRIGTALAYRSGVHHGS